MAGEGVVDRLTLHETSVKIRRVGAAQNIDRGKLSHYSDLGCELADPGFDFLWG